MGKGEELLEAIKCQDISVVQKILHKGKGKILGSSKKVNVNFQNEEGLSPLHQASLHANVDIVCLLIDANATLDLQDANGMRALHYSSLKGKVEVVAALLESGSKASTPAKNGVTPLHLAAQYGQCSVCAMLMQYGGDPTVRRHDGATPIDLACEFGRYEVVEIFLTNSSCISLIESYAVQHFETELSNSNSPLHVAARNGHIKVIRLLLQSGANINWKTSSGTCLHEAVAHEKLEVVQLLIDCGIDTSRRSGLGQTAFDLAKKLPSSRVNREIVRILSDAQPGFVQVCAINDFKNVLDPTSLSFTKGTIITLLERNSNGNWKGKVEGSAGNPPRVGYFPSAYVQPHQRSLHGSDDSGIHPHDDECIGAGNTPQNVGGAPVLPHHNNHHHQFSPWPKVSVSPTNRAPPHPPKYINVDPSGAPTPQPALNKVMLVNPNVNNPSYDDVIYSQQMNDRPHPNSSPNPPITVSRSTQDMGVLKPHISNPGYEDVLVDHSSNGPISSPSTVSSHYSRQRVSPLPHRSPQSQNWPDNAHNNQQHNIPKENLSRVSTKSSQSSRQAPYVDRSSKELAFNPADEEVFKWLRSFGLEQYTSNFIEHGYDLATISHTSPADLTAIQIAKPAHRKKLSTHVSQLRKDSPTSPLINEVPNSAFDFLSSLSLTEYVPVFISNDVNSLEKILHTTWEDLQVMKINRLGHQKKIILAITKLNQLCKRQPEKFQKTPTPSKIQPPHYQQYSNLPQEQLHQRESPPQHSPPQHYPTPAPKPQQVTPMSKKPPVQAKPKKNFSSFKENPGLSLELQKALSRRQNIIDNAPPSPEQPNTFQKPQKPPVNGSHPHQQGNGPKPSFSEPTHTQPTYPTPPFKQPTYTPPTHTPPSHSPTDVGKSHLTRGPRPSPPRRTTSISEDQEEEEQRINVRSLAAKMDPIPADTRKMSSVAKIVKTPTSPVHKSGNFSFTPTSLHQSSPPSSIPPQSYPAPAPKPLVTPKPQVSKKPPVQKKPPTQPPKPHPIAQEPPQVAEKSRKISHGELGKHFDLSVLDNIDKQKQSVFPIKPSKPTPPVNHTPPQREPMSAPSPQVSNSEPTSSKLHPPPMDRYDSSSDEFEWPAPPAFEPPPPLPSAISPQNTPVQPPALIVQQTVQNATFYK
nr:caskin-2-like [Ciona intestinalis]|eukprot:XP_018667422.1 caskin-2-like [Ciona intestinalis]